MAKSFLHPLLPSPAKHLPWERQGVGVGRGGVEARRQEAWGDCRKLLDCFYLHFTWRIFSFQIWKDRNLLNSIPCTWIHIPWDRNDYLFYPKTCKKNCMLFLQGKRFFNLLSFKKKKSKKQVNFCTILKWALICVTWELTSFPLSPIFWLQIKWLFDNVIFWLNSMNLIHWNGAFIFLQ